MKRFIPLIFLSALTGCAGSSAIHQSNQFSNNGLDPKAAKLAGTYQASTIEVKPDWLTPELLQGIEQQLVYLGKKSVPANYNLPGLTLSKTQLQQSLAQLQQLAERPADNKMTAWQLAGEDGRGNVQFTGYYVPVFQVRSQSDAVYKYPIYRKPSGISAFPSREQIDFDGALKGQGLELFYSASLIDNFFMQVQGSGMVQDELGQQHLLSYGGGNGQPYRSLGKVLIEMGEYKPEQMSASAIKDWLSRHPHRQRELMRQNPSYTFFQKGPTQPVGAANVPLTPLHSIAVDPAYIPLGSVLLAQIPVLDAEGQLVRHQYQLLLAQDKGAAIKTPGRIDLYQGVGPEAQHRADALKHYGKIWLLTSPQ
ncbi:murein transglycosylase A [Rheinheimera sp.]|uniref:murein transglycosylase A n=1 Tax=Rheinheimera sp. TaxID=1869214 RepID=UPI003AF8CFB4